LEFTQHSADQWAGQPRRYSGFGATTVYVEDVRALTAAILAAIGKESRLRFFLMPKGAVA
jgi:hypothetical protein